MPNDALGSAGLLVAVLLTTVSPVSAHTGTADGEWPTFGSDLRHTRCAPQTDSPMRCALDSVRSLVVAISDGSSPGEPVAVRLPEG